MALLKPLKKPKKVYHTRFCVLDYETINWIESYSMGFYDGKDKRIFWGKKCTEQFLGFFLRKKYRGYICFGHNGGKFDFNFIFQYFQENKEMRDKFDVVPLEINGRFIEFKIYSKLSTGKKNHCWILRDSVGYFQQTLGALTKAFQVEHEKGEFDHSKINWSNWKQLASEWTKYLESDVVGLYEVLEAWEEELIQTYHVNLRTSITIAQMAMRVYRTNFQKVLLTSTPAHEDFIRPSYYGGRVEVFKRYGENLRYYDVNSLYPHVMHKYPVPMGSPVKSFTMTEKDFGILKCKILVPKNLDIPVLPVRHNGKLIFPTGELTGTWCTPEIREAVAQGCIILKYLGGLRYEQGFPFTEYVETLYKIKSEATDPVKKQTAKLLMNSLYGKFGQSRKKTKLLFNPESLLGLTPLDPKNDTGLFKKDVQSKARHIIPAIASFITCYARLELYDGFKQVKKLGGSVYYCDTDSMVTDIDIPSNQKELGAWADELDGQQIVRGYFLAPKFYYCAAEKETFVRAKGFFKDTCFTEIAFAHAIKTDVFSHFTSSVERPASIKESLRRNKTAVSTIVRTRTMKTKYDKRIVTDGINTKPLYLVTEQE